MNPSDLPLILRQPIGIQKSHTYAMGLLWVRMANILNIGLAAKTSSFPTVRTQAISALASSMIGQMAQPLMRQKRTVLMNCIQLLR